MKTRNLTVDTFRLFAALEVIILHVNFDALPVLLPVALRLQARWAVPFFFIISGYYLARQRADSPGSNFGRAIYRMAWVFGIWALIYSPLAAYQHDVREVFRRIFTLPFVYSGTYFHLWFPSSMILGILFLSFCQHYRLEKLIPLASILILLHIFLAGSYDIFDIKFPFEFETARHWVSVPCLALGVWLQRHGPLNRLAAFLLVIAGLTFQAVEAYLLLTRFSISAYNHEILLGTIPLAFGAASLALSRIKIFEQPVLGRWGKNYSLGIYLIHPLMVFLIGYLSGWIPLSAAIAPVFQIIFPIVVLFACIGFFAFVRWRMPWVFDWLIGNHHQQFD
jgi:surface polysaccharide O-acyltransferase-like enzyme